MELQTTKGIKMALEYRLRTKSDALYADALDDGRVFLTRFAPNDSGGNFMITAEEAVELRDWLIEVTA